jgi:hypothetical protein
MDKAREGGLEAPTRHPLEWRSPEFWDKAALEKELERVFDMPRLSPLLQPVQRFPDAFRCGR